ncbi:hypothetical protein B7Z28_00780 [Candidatus Saccharibacteria bacterium 32-45-3]|nr:MAG: hypothetical protein B7Z28_00780 [Candidatus Saccharibacteria bacterium 32-45-3]
MDDSLIFLFAAILIVGALLFAAITLTKNSPKQLDVERYRVKWLSIEQELKKDSPSSFHLSVLNADKLLDHALKDRAFKGETMGERMKSAKSTWSSPNGVWNAHKLRNRIAHESDVHVTYDEAHRALGGFKQALRDLGAI